MLSEPTVPSTKLLFTSKTYPDGAENLARVPSLKYFKLLLVNPATDCGFKVAFLRYPVQTPVPIVVWFQVILRSVKTIFS